MDVSQLAIDVDTVKRALCLKRFYRFVLEFWDIIINEPLVDNWHIKYICDELQEVAETMLNNEVKNYDLVINIPPATTKSTLATIMLPAWIWAKDSTKRILTGSYSGALSSEHSSKSRDVIKSEKYQRLFNVHIRKDTDGKTHYKSFKGGERYATSVGGTVTGFHAHIIIIDDPLNPKEAVSDVQRLSANEFMSGTLATRKIDKNITPTILIMQRLHENDPAGVMLEQKKKGKEIKHINLPADTSGEILPREIKEFYRNGLLDEVRLSRKILDDLKISLGSYHYAGQMLQTPAPLKGGIWQNWFKVYDEFPVVERDGRRVKGEPLYVGTDWDLAYTKNDSNSASAYVTAGKIGNDMYIIDLGFDWLEFPHLIEFMKSKRAPHYIENKASGKSAKQVLINQGINAVEVDVDGGDKIARATMATPYAEAGRIFVHRSLIDKLLHHEKQGILKFPNNHNDDLNDVLVQSINRLLGQPQIFTF